MKPAYRALLLGLALAATIVASVMDFTAFGPPPEAETGPVSRSSVSLQKAAPPARTPEQAANAAAERLGPSGRNLFAVPPVPAPARPAAVLPQLAASAPAPPPQAPALPFVYQGKLLEQDRVTAFLSLGPRTFLLRKGDVVTDYRVVDIQPAGMTLLYLPLNIEQRLSFGSAQ